MLRELARTMVDDGVAIDIRTATAILKNPRSWETEDDGAD